MTAPRPEHTRIGEAASVQACPRCRRHVLVARSAGLIVRADPENLTIAGELAARLQNRSTYDIHIHGLPRRMYLEYRTLMRIRAGRKHPVVAQHLCGSQVEHTIRYDDTVKGIVISYGKGFPDVPPF